MSEEIIFIVWNSVEGRMNNTYESQEYKVDSVDNSLPQH